MFKNQHEVDAKYGRQESLDVPGTPETPDVPDASISSPARGGGFTPDQQNELQSMTELLRAQNPHFDYKWNKPASIVPGDWLDTIGDIVSPEVDFPVWEDERVPVTATVKGGNDPDFAVFKTNGAGSRGVFIEWFDDAAEEELFFTVQLSHGYQEGTDLRPHVHWVPEVNGGAGEVVCWGLEYTWANIGVTFGNTTIIYGNTHSPVDNPLVASRHYYTELPAIVGTGNLISSMLVCRLFRDAAGVGLIDDYGDDAGLLEIDFHYLADSHGSSDEWVK